MQVTINVPEHLAAEAAARGMALDMYVEEVLAKQAQQMGSDHPKISVKETVDWIRSLRQGVRLDGLKIRNLIHEGHKY